MSRRLMIVVLIVGCGGGFCFAVSGHMHEMAVTLGVSCLGSFTFCMYVSLLVSRDRLWVGLVLLIVWSVEDGLYSR